MPRSQLGQDEVETMRVRMVSAALALYRSEGLEAISFRRLATALGLSHTLAYRYFADKDALLAAMRRACTEAFEQYVRAREGEGPALARIRAVSAAYIGYVLEHPQDYLLVFSTVQPPPTRFPELLAARRSLFDHVVEVLADAVRGRVLRGNPVELAHRFWVAAHGLMTLHVANQLVHGRDLHQLAGPLIESTLASARPAPRARAARTATRRTA